MLACDVEAPSLARRAVAKACHLGGVEGERCENAQLATSELVTNAVVHGRSRVLLTCLVDAVTLSVRVEVGDDNSRHPQVQPRDDGALDGRGLFIVDLLATRWGVRDTASGKLVWFELAEQPG